MTAEQVFTVALTCPRCSRKLRPAPLYRAATIVVRRTCPRCTVRWSVRVTPLPVRLRGVHAVHEAEWTYLGER